MSKNMLRLGCVAAVSLVAVVVASAAATVAARHTPRVAIGLLTSPRNATDRVPASALATPAGAALIRKSSRAMGRLDDRRFWAARTDDGRICIVTVPNDQSVMRAGFVCGAREGLRHGTLMAIQRGTHGSIDAVGLVRDGFRSVHVVGARRPVVTAVHSNVYRLHIAPVHGHAPVVVIGGPHREKIRTPLSLG